MMVRFVFALALAVFALTRPAHAAGAASPGGTLAVSVATNGEGRVTYSITRAGKPVIVDSELGFLFTDAPQMLRNFEIVGARTSGFDQSWDQPWGEWKTIRNHYTELRVSVREKTGLARRLDIVFRLFDDAVGFRYEFPEQPNLKTAHIAEELTQFRLAENATAWWCEAFESNREEYLYHRTPVAEIGIAQTPLTLKTDSGLYLALHEAALVDYAGMNIAKVEGRNLKAVLTPSGLGAKVTRAAPFATPWRVLLVAASAPALYPAAQAILNLNEPNVLGDVSWVHPRKYVGIWWGMHLDTESWASGAKHGATTANAMRYIDFAARNGIPGLLMEGWNQGWDGDWFANGETFSFTRPYPDLDLPRVAAYAKARGVHIIGHHETSANAAHYEEQMGAAFDYYRSLGIDAVKTGYVSDAGGAKVKGPDGRILYTWHEGQPMVEHHLRVVTEAAKRHIAVNAHEPVKDTGLRRTYPNWISREGQRGMEYNAWGVPKNPPGHEANLVFTRMLSGPMDFTPGVLSLTGRGGTPILSTAAKQLALYVVLYSPIQMAADLPENYALYPGPFRFIRDVPTDWADTRMLAGEPGDYAVFARRDRASADWYIGAVGDEDARVLTVKLDFLSPGRRYVAQIYRDGDDADYRTGKRHSIVIERRAVTSAGTLTLRLAPGGGQAIRFRAGR